MRSWTRILALGGQRWRAVALALALVGVLLAGIACGGSEPTTAPAAQSTQPAVAPFTPVTIKIQDNTFETMWIENAIVKFIVEKGYGHQIEEVVANTVVGQTALQKGDLDVNIELWPGNIQEWYDAETAKGTIVKLGDIYEGGDQFFVIPKWVADQYNIKTVEDMKRPEVVQLFPDPENPQKGVFYNCPIGWQCQVNNAVKFKVYGLDKFYNLVEPGTAVALDASLVGAQKQKRPVFGYYWAPTSIYGGYEWHILQEPVYTEECWAEILKASADLNYTAKQACAYATQPTLVVVSGKFYQEGPPEVLEFLKRINVGRVPVSQTAAWAVENDIQGDWEKAAVYYLRTFEDRWTTWMPADKVQKVKEALARIS